MNDLGKIKVLSFKEIEKDPIIGGQKWVVDIDDCIANTTVFADDVFITISIHLHFNLNTFVMAVSSPFSSHIYLKSTTAKEAAIESLELVRIEAQKLVDSLGGKEPQKEPFFDEFKNALINIISGHPTKNKEQRVWKAAFDYCLILANKYK